MSDLQSQINLLNEYIKTLQKQNLSKSNQIRTLTDQNNQMIIQCQNLRKKSKTTTIINNTTSSSIQRLQSQLKQLKTAYAILLENSSKSTQSLKLTQTIRRLQQQKFILFQYKQKLQKQIRQFGYHNIDIFLIKFKQYQNIISQSHHKIKLYQTKIIDYERKMTLLSNQINIKTSEIQRLNDKVKMNNNENNNTNNVIKNYQIQVNNYQKKITQITNQLVITKAEIQRFQEKIKSVSIYQRDYENIKREYDGFRREYENIKRQYDNTKRQYEGLKRQYDNGKKQNQTIKRQNQNIRRQSQNLKRQIQGLKRQIDNLRQQMSSLSNNNSQISIFQSTINTLRAQHRQLQSQKNQLYLRISSLQSQIVQKSNIIGQLRLHQQYLSTLQSQSSSKDNQLSSLTGTIRSLRLQLQQQKRIILTRESTIRNLQTKISSFDYSKSSQIANIQKIVQDKNNEMNRLIQNHNYKVTNLQMQIEKYKQIAVNNTQINNQMISLNEENNFLKKQAYNNTQLIQELQRQKQNLKIRIVDLQQQLIKFKNTQNNNVSVSRYQQIQTENGDNQQLKKIVRQLRVQLQQVKRSNAVIHGQNYQMQKYLSQLAQSQIQINNNIPYFGNDSKIRYANNPQFNIETSQLRMQYQKDSHNNHIRNRSKHIHSPYFKSEVNIEKKRQNIVQRSVNSPPVRDIRSPNNNNNNNNNNSNNNNNNNNKQKWENLQRKISALRVQNDQLKKTLLYD